MKLFRLPLLISVFAGSIQMPVMAQAVTATLPVTCRADGTQCVPATPVVNPDGTNIGAGGGGSVPTGTAGSPNAAVVTVQGITGGTPQNTNIVNPLPAGANTIGAISNTTFAATQSGTWTDQVVGNVATGATDAGNAVKVGGVAYANPSVQTAVSAGQRQNAVFDLNGGQFVRVYGISSSPGGTYTTIGYDQDAAGNLKPHASANFVFNGSGFVAQPGDTTGAYAVNTPTASANNSLSSSTVAAVTSNVLKNSAGNVYSLNLVNGSVAGFVVLYDATAAPTSGTALTTGLIRYCFPMAASAGFDKAFQMPMAMTNGAVLLASTSCTTYTALGTAPVLMTGQVK